MSPRSSDPGRADADATPVAGFRAITVLAHPRKQDAVNAYVDAVRQRAPDLGVEVRVPTSTADLRAQARAARDAGVDLVVVAGGDGTVWHALNALAEGETALTALPLGTGNDFARELGVETVDDGVRALFGGTVGHIDAGRCVYHGADGEETAWFASTAGVGMMANVFRLEPLPLAQRLKALLGNGVWPLLTAYSALTFQARPARVAFDEGHVVDDDLLALEISKVREAGHEEFTPGARLDNGVLDVWRLPQAGFLKIARFFVAVLRGGQRHLALPVFEYYSGEGRWNPHGLGAPRRLRVDSAVPLPVHLHGDHVGETPVAFELVPGALKVLRLR